MEDEVKELHKVVEKCNLKIEEMKERIRQLTEENDRLEKNVEVSFF